MTEISSYSLPARKSSKQAGAGADRRQYSGLFFLPLSRSLVLSQATKYEFIQRHISFFLTLANATPVFLTVFEEFSLRISEHRVKHYLRLSQRSLLLLGLIISPRDLKYNAT